MILVIPVLLFFVVLGVVVWRRRGNPEGQLGTDPQAHRNSVPPANPATGPGTGMGEYGASGFH
jgi:hypothetical protein